MNPTPSAQTSQIQRNAADAMTLHAAPHYSWHPSLKQIDVARECLYNVGSAIKYVWRFRHKGTPAADLTKALWHIADEVKRRHLGAAPNGLVRPLTTTGLRNAREKLMAHIDDPAIPRMQTEALAHLIQAELQPAARVHLECAHELVGKLAEELARAAA